MKKLSELSDEDCLQAYLATKSPTAKIKHRKGIISAVKTWIYFDNIPYQAADLLRSLGYQIENQYEKEVDWDEVTTDFAKSKYDNFIEYLRTHYKLIKSPTHEAN